MRKILFFIFLFLFIVSQNFSAFAIYEAFNYESVSEEIQTNFINNINISLLSEEPKKQPIEVFDINKNGLIAIGNEHLDYKTVCIYSDEGVFQYGYKFNCSGSFGVEWNENNINIYFVRSDISVEVDSSGNIKEVLKIQNNTQNNYYWNNVVFANKKELNNTVFSLENDMGILNLFSSDYSQLVKTDYTGDESIIYDVNSEKVIKTYLVLILFFSFVIIAFINLKKLFSDKESIRTNG